ncbi:helix-turn-helix domain-containing protein [Streptomyces sp. NPDC058417]|uniref:helix-turn-helix domain-containing protein n=1 Tax=unclassified Streptomyces TaxID=2593676 RepID=UPI003645F8DF
MSKRSVAAEAAVVSSRPTTLSAPVPGAPDEDSVRAWLAGVGARRVLTRPGPLYGLHDLGAGWILECPAGLPDHLLQFVASGACTVSSEGQHRSLAAGSVLWIRPGAPFVLRGTGHRPTTVHRFRLTGDPATDAPLGPALCLEDAWELRAAFNALTTELPPGPPSALPYREELVRGLLLVLFSTLFRQASWRPGGVLLSPAARYAVENYVDSTLAQRPRVSDLARVAGLSPDYFTRVFRRTFSMPPREWIVTRRVQRATVLLQRHDRSVAQVAAELGYTDSFLFSRQFKAVTGLAPQNYRGRTGRFATRVPCAPPTVPAVRAFDEQPARPVPEREQPDARQAQPDIRAAQPDARQSRPDARRGRAEARHDRADARHGRPRRGTVSR